MLLNFSPDRLDFLDNKKEYSLSSQIKTRGRFSDNRFSLTTGFELYGFISPITVKYKEKDLRLKSFSTNKAGFNLADPDSPHNHTFFIDISFFHLDQNIRVDFSLQSSIPLLDFAPGKDVEAFGELGEVSPKFIVSNIRIVGTPSKNEKIYSVDTNQLTSLTLNTQNYVDCLNSELANLP